MKAVSMDEILKFCNILPIKSYLWSNYFMGFRESPSTRLTNPIHFLKEITFHQLFPSIYIYISDRYTLNSHWNPLIIQLESSSGCESDAKRRTETQYNKYEDHDYDGYRNKDSFDWQTSKFGLSHEFRWKRHIYVSFILLAMRRAENQQQHWK